MTFELQRLQNRVLKLKTIRIKELALRYHPRFTPNQRAAGDDVFLCDCCRIKSSISHIIDPNNASEPDLNVCNHCHMMIYKIWNKHDIKPALNKEFSKIKYQNQMNWFEKMLVKIKKRRKCDV